jgi:hypothetical protein
MAEAWFYGQNNQQHGPVSAERLRQLTGTGQVQPTDLVWKEGLADWVEARTVPELTAAALAAPAPPAAEFASQSTFVDPIGDEEPPVRPWSRRLRREQPEGLGTGAKVALFGGGALLLILAIAVSLVIVFSRKDDATAQAGLKNPRIAPGQNAPQLERMIPGGAGPGMPGPGGKPKPQPPGGLPPGNGGGGVNEFTMTLGVNQWKDYRVNFKAGDRPVITVKNTTKSDVDVFILDGTGKTLAKDDADDPDCRIDFWVAPRTDAYTIRVWNRQVQAPPARNIQTTCTLRWSL